MQERDDIEAMLHWITSELRGEEVLLNLLKAVNNRHRKNAADNAPLRRDVWTCRPIRLLLLLLLLLWLLMAIWHRLRRPVSGSPLSHDDTAAIGLCLAS